MATDTSAAPAAAGAPRVPRPAGPPLPSLVQSWLWLRHPLGFLGAAQRRYGDVFTVRLLFGNRLVVLARPDLIHAAVAAAGEDLRAGEANRALLEPLLGVHSVLLLDGREHLRQRRLLLPAFHGERMRSWEGAIREITAETVAAMPRGTPFALRPHMQRLTQDVILRVVFGLDGGASMDEMRLRVGEVVALSRRPFGVALSMGHPLGGLSPYGRFLRARDRLDAAIHAQIRRRRDAGDAAARSDVLSTLLLARDETGDGMTDAEIRDELVTLLFAGHETTATTLAWCVDLLTHAPAAMSRLVAETGAGETGYLNAVINETLRLRPPVFLVVRHAGRPVRLDGVRVDAGMTLAPSIHLLHRNPALYPDPNRFVPERFAGRQPEPRHWMPFGGGIRRCLGAAFAVLEMRVALPELLRRVRVEAASPEPERERREAVTLVPDRGTRVIVHDRG